MMRASFVAALLGACVDPGKDTDAARDSAAPADELTVDGLEVSVATIATVLEVRWRTDAPLRSDVTATFGDETITLSETEADSEHHAVLVGFPPQTEVTVRVTADGTDAAAAAVATTGALPPWVPDLTYDALEPDAAEPGIRIAPVILPTGGGVIGVDARGRVVWSYPPQEPLMEFPYRTRRSLDGEALLLNSNADSVDMDAKLYRIPLTGDHVTVIPVRGAHSDFAEYTPGGYLALGWDIRDVGDGRLVLGDTILERAPDGTERVVWSVWDDFSPDLSQTYSSFYPADPSVEDWSHVNSLAYDPTTDRALVTTTWNSAVVAVDRASGELAWWFNDFGGTYASEDPPGRVDFPHSVQPIDGGVLVFSRGNFNSPGACSSAVDVALDDVALTSRETWRHTADDCLLVTFLGGAERLPGGNTLISWTTAGRLDEVTPLGDLAWSVGTPIGAAFGYAALVDGLGHP